MRLCMLLRFHDPRRDHVTPIASTRLSQPTPGALVVRVLETQGPTAARGGQTLKGAP
jgi:hypothetical protein